MRLKKIILIILSLMFFGACEFINNSLIQSNEYSNITSHEANQAFTYMMDEFFLVQSQKWEDLGFEDPQDQYIRNTTTLGTKVEFLDYEIHNPENGYTTLSGTVKMDPGSPKVFAFDVTFTTGTVKIITGKKVLYENHENATMEFYANSFPHSITGYVNPYE